MRSASTWNPSPAPLLSPSVEIEMVTAPDDSPRVKFLCSFGGSILPRPIDGRLRYVGGETRIVTVPRDVSYDELLARMRELFDGASIIKYQQPDEDLDALVSLVNDEDVTNMMEEYDKLGTAGDGSTWLRIFLSSQYPDHDTAVVGAHFDADDREAERRYIDALNSLSDAKSSSPPDISEHYLDGGIHNQVKLRHLTIPHPSHAQRYGEMDAPFSPALFSPGQHSANDPQEFSPSSSSARFHHGAGEFNDRIADEYARQSAGHQHQMHQYDHQSPSPVENLVWIPTGAIVQEKSGFPTNLGHSHNMIDGNGYCEHCRKAFQRNHGIMPDARFLNNCWKHGQPYMEQPKMVNDYLGHLPNSCAECSGTRDPHMVNLDIKIGHGVFAKEHSEQHHLFVNESQGYERGWPMHSHQVTHRLEDMRINYNGMGRANEHFVVDGNMMNAPFAHGNINDEHSFPANCIGRDETHYLRHGTNTGNEVFLPQQAVGNATGTNAPRFEDTAVRYRNQPSAYGMESLYQVSNNLNPVQSLLRNRQVPTCPATPYELSNSMIPNGGPDSSFTRYTQEGSPRFPYVRVEDQIPNALPSQNNSMSQRMLGFEETAAPDYLYHHGNRPNPKNTPGPNGVLPLAPDSIPCSPGKMHVKVTSEAVSLLSAPSCPIDNDLIVSCATGDHQSPILGSDLILEMQSAEEKNLTEEAFEEKHGISKEPDAHILLSPKSRQNVELAMKELQLSEVEGYTSKIVDANTNVAHGDEYISEENLNFLPELIASVKKAVLEGAEEVIARAQSVSESVATPELGKIEPLHDREPESTNADVHTCLEGNSEHEKLCKTEPVTADAEALAKGLQNANADGQAASEGSSEHETLCKIEPTTAEAEALAKGLQTIKNDDLEEIRELGSGTFGSVYHGKWRGSDVAIKRIKASCFAGRPSERERLIADFWKEALIMSYLHHPNIVSFYGVVRDGPDGSLATVTEFMINGSLKQFLQKKDRTIDRRKRLIIAMDVAFGMEYLHGKNIVHFDLKCENLLVNMRDPHRPVCKIGDLGLSKVKQHTLVSGGLRGTLPWMAPELLSGKSNMVSEKIDVYSYGIVMWELLTGEEPYADMRCASIIGGIINNTIRPKIPTWCDPEWKSLMESCWSSDPALRPSFSEISQKLRKMAAAINLK
ncbi:unnamed protein product [Musa textilis]